MIHLHLAIYEGDIEQIDFENIVDLVDYIRELNRFDCIWLATEDGEKGEIIITEDLDALITCIENNVFIINIDEGSQDFFVQEYQTYEDAYAVALDMREGNKRCYNTKTT